MEILGRSKHKLRILLFLTMLMTMAGMALGDTLPKLNPVVLQQREAATWWVGLDIVIAMIVLMLMFWMYIYLKSKAEGKIRTASNRLSLLLQSGNTSIWIYDIPTNTFRHVDEKRRSFESYSILDFMQQYEYADQEVCHEAITRLRDKKSTQESLVMHTRVLNDGDTQRYLDTSISVLSSYEDEPEVLIATQKDITMEQQKREEVRTLMLRYHAVFYHTSMDMIYFDAKGQLMDLNDNACTSYKVTDKKAFLETKPNLLKLSFFCGVTEPVTEPVSLSSVIDLKTQMEHFGTAFQPEHPQTIYYQAMLTPIYNKDHQLICIFLAGRDITQEVEVNHHQKASLQKLQEATNNIHEYIDSINYTLKESGIRMIYYYPDTHYLKLRRDMDTKRLVLSQLRCVELAAPEYRPSVVSLIRKMDNKLNFTYDITFKTIFYDKKNGRDVYLQLIGVPMVYGEHAEFRYFGLCLDVSERMSIKQKLELETQKALETEKLKNAFLTNMSYEIRTPLNAVVGFAELFNQEHSREDEALFVEQIKTNSGTLLKLINDILFLSRLDAHRVELSIQPIDVAQTFEGHCRMGWAEHLHEGVNTSVLNPYEYCLVEIDDNYLGQAITTLCSVMADNTTSGMISVQYEYRHNELAITMENTGEGIPKDLLPYLFDRFVKSQDGKQYGSGLSLPIVKELIEQMGGKIDVMSEEGKGITVWITIPCQFISFNKNMDHDNR